jgi:hypothetical protein
MLKKDDLRLGILLGFLAPLISFIIYYFVKFYPLFSVGDMFNAVAANKNLVTAISVTCLVANIALFTVYVNTRRDKTAKGIFAITLVYAIGALLLKYLL